MVYFSYLIPPRLYRAMFALYAHQGGTYFKFSELFDMTCKPAKTFKEQISILRDDHKLSINDEQSAINCLKSVNYYHYRGYYIHLMEENQLYFKEGVTFEMIDRLQKFDEDLRVSLWIPIQSIELSFRTKIAYVLAHLYGPLGYLDSTNFRNSDYHKAFLAKLSESIKKSSEIFVKHFREKDEALPIWAAIELISLGSLSKLFSNMKATDQARIAREFFGLDEKLIDSYLCAISNIRNICAHCGRIYHKRLTRVKVREENAKLVERYAPEGYSLLTSTFFAVLLAIKDLLPRDEWDNFVNLLTALIRNYSDVVDPIHLGMPYTWEIILRE